MEKLNCWEFMKCGREEGGSKAEELGVCPAAKETLGNGLNDGVNAGRICWVIAGTLCGGETQGQFVYKYENCLKCEFYKYVDEEEGLSNRLSDILRNLIESGYEYF